MYIHYKKFLVVILLISVSCILFHTPDYFPLEEGYKWIYSCSDIQGGYTKTDEVVGERQLSNGDIVKVVVETVIRGNDVEVDTQYIYKDERKVLLYTDINNLSYQTLLELPLKEGDSWIVTEIPNISKSEVLVLHQGEEVIVPYKTVKNCYKLQLTYTYLGVSVIYYVWFGPDIGVVKVQAVNGSMIEELTEFEE